MTLADKYTSVRILFAPIFVVLYFLPDYFGVFTAVSGWIMLPLLCLAEFTDFLDGFYARKTNTVSDFGKLYDPFADVILHLTTFFCYVKDGYISIFILILLFYREFAMLFLRMAAVKKGVAIGARKGGKFKTVFYIATSFVCLIIESLKRIGVSLNNNEPILIVICCMSIICVCLSYGSFIDYIKCFMKIKNNSNISVDKK